MKIHSQRLFLLDVERVSSFWLIALLCSNDDVATTGTESAERSDVFDECEQSVRRKTPREREMRDDKNEMSFIFIDYGHETFANQPVQKTNHETRLWGNIRLNEDFWLVCSVEVTFEVGAFVVVVVVVVIGVDWLRWDDVGERIEGEVTGGKKFHEVSWGEKVDEEEAR